MKIAVTSQNFRTITGHAGKTRRFIIYEAHGPDVREVRRLDLPKEQSFHEWPADAAHPTDGIDVLITASCGDNFVARLARRGIRVLPTGETDPETAVRLVSMGQPLAPAERHEHHGPHRHGHS